MKTTNWIIIGFTMSLVMSGCSSPQQTSPSAPVTTKSLDARSTKILARQDSPAANDLQIKLNSHSDLRGAKIQVAWTSKNTMVMRGTVLSRRQKKRAGEIADKLQSATVANELQVQKKGKR